MVFARSAQTRRQPTAKVYPPMHVHKGNEINAEGDQDPGRDPQVKHDID